MNSIVKTQQYVKTRVLPYIKPKHIPLFKFGLKAFTLTPYQTLAANAREVVENRNTASSKVYRLVSNTTILSDFESLLSHSGFVRKNSLVNVDFSTFCGFETLAFGVQTGKGRAIPIWADALTYPITSEGSQNIFVLDTISKLGETLGFYPRFVFDRGFWIPIVMKYFLDHHIRFYLRIKAGQTLNWVKKQGIERKRAKVIGIHTKDAFITLYGYHMRLLISPPPPKKHTEENTKKPERWYIVTNDVKTKREKILHIYRCRFEIEESFRDLKHIGDLKTLRIRMIQTFRILLYFAALSFWIAFWGRTTGKVIVHLKKQLSFFRVWFEDVQRQIREKTLSVIVDT